MKKVFLLSITIFISHFSFSQYVDNNEACFYRATGKGITSAEIHEKSKIWSHGMDFTCWNGNTT